MNQMGHGSNGSWVKYVMGQIGQQYWTGHVGLAFTLGHPGSQNYL